MHLPSATLLFLMPLPLSSASAQDSLMMISSDRIAGIHPDLSATSTATIERYQRRQAFIGQCFMSMSAATADTVLLFRISRLRANPFVISPKELAGIVPSRDFVANQIRQRDVGNAPGFEVGALLSQGTSAVFGKPKTVKEARRLHLIPSEAEISVLKILWAEKKATGSFIYAQMDSLRLTAAAVQQILTVMTDRGLLLRQQISPRDEFTIITPFGVVAIEKSELNRKNREYLYQPAVSADEMWSFLDATLFNLQSAAVNNTDDLLTQHVRRLMQLLATAPQ